MRRVFGLLLGPVPNGTRWWSVPLRLIGPGSVPLAALLTITCVLNYDSYTAHGYAAVLIPLAQCGAIVAAGHRPLLGWALAFGGFWVFAATVLPAPQSAPAAEPWPWPASPLLAYLVVMFAVARGRGLAVAALAWTIPLFAGTLLALGRSVEGSTENLQAAAAFSAVAVVAGAVVRMRAGARARLAEEERLTAEERDRRRLLEERTRIARELHDVVAHHMSVIAVQSTTAEYRIEDVSDAARAEFRSIGEQARESLTEMRRLLSVLRSADEAGVRAPQPGLDRIGTLLDATERAGVTVRVERREVPDELPEAVSLTGYRIVQEALSNVVRHAPGATARLTLAGNDDRLVVEVENEPVPAGSAPDWNTHGMGLAGMRERVALLGGAVSAGPTAEGGFAVRASLPATGGRPGVARPEGVDGSGAGGKTRR